MVNINNKRWEDVESEDIQALLSRVDDETFFFEFKADDESPKKLMNEISAFSNTYGGYVFLGVKNDKTIEGCKAWNEQRIHTSIHDSITPTPNFDVRKFNMGKDCDVFVIKVEQGNMPPYITGEGKIYERLSSGSFVIKDSAKLAHLYTKHQDELKKVKNKIELKELDKYSEFPSNICGYIDLGFDVICSEQTRLSKEFYRFDYSKIAEYLKTRGPFSLSRVGASLFISIGEAVLTKGSDKKYLPQSGLHDFIEILADGSVRCRNLLIADVETGECSINSLSFLRNTFKEIYKMLFGEDFINIFRYANKYEKLEVLKQFSPCYNYVLNGTNDELKKQLNNLLNIHREKFGNNLIIESDRYPKNDYQIIDKRYMDSCGIKYDAGNLITELFVSIFDDLGYIENI